MMPTGPFVRKAPLMQSMAVSGTPRWSFSPHLYSWKSDITVSEHNTMSTRQLVPARCISKLVSVTRHVSSASWGERRFA